MQIGSGRGRGRGCMSDRISSMGLKSRRAKNVILLTHEVSQGICSTLVQ